MKCRSVAWPHRPTTSMNRTMRSWICVIGLIVLCKTAAGTSDFGCEIVDNEDKLNCTKLVMDVTRNQGECATNYRRLILKVGYDDNKCVRVASSEVNCVPAYDKHLSKVKEELCNLTRAYIANGTGSDILQFNITESPASFTLPKHDAIIRLIENSTARYLGVAMARLFKKTVHVGTDNSLVTYNNFRVGNNSKVLIISVVDQYGDEVNERVEFIMKMQIHPISDMPEDSRLMKSRRVCMYFDTTKFEWSSQHCQKLWENANETACACKHNSAFAVVFAVRKIDIDPKILDASMALEIVSIAALLLSVIMLAVYRKRMRNFDRVLLQINLCIALLLTHLFFIVSPLAVHTRGLCEALALATHYFLVATAVLMVMEGALMLTKVLAPTFLSNTSAKRRRIIALLVAWILPLIYVGSCGAAGISQGTYAPWSIERGRYENCWVDPSFILTVIVPISTALAINIGIAIRLGVLVWRMSKNAEEFKPSNLRDVNKASHAGKALRAVVILLPILGIPWTLGFLVNIAPVEEVFASIHIIVNGLQGLLLFLHYVIFNNEMRASLQRTWKSAITNVTSLTPTVQFTSKRSESVTVLKND